jgi:hypothetical protein
VHAYEVSRRQPFPSIPSARPAHAAYSPSSTPIYDALYAEYLKSFRTLPGDRSGEERLAFGGPWRYGHGSGGGFTGGYASSVHAARHGAEPSAPSPWQRVGRLAPGGARPEDRHLPRAEEPAGTSPDPSDPPGSPGSPGSPGRHKAPQAALPPAPRVTE